MDAFGGFGVGNNGTGDVQVTIATPEIRPEGAGLIACVAARLNADCTQADWEEVVALRSVDDQECTVYIFRRTATATEPADYSFTLGVSAKAAGVMVTALGADPSFDDAIAFVPWLTSSLDITAPSISPVRVGDLLLWFGAMPSATLLVTPPEGMTFAAEAQSTGTPTASNAWVGCCYQENIPSGPTGDKIGTVDANQRGHGILIAVQTQAAGPESLSVPFTSSLS